ncbi:MAG TPA: hypothetical protein VLA13_06235 [Massilibacterium sp.]|nr:hypothetical protein [Massilibacterium sp.]
MADNKKIKTFPLTVTDEWLEQVEKARTKSESKHEFILKAVKNEIQKRKDGYDIIKEDE